MTVPVGRCCAGITLLQAADLNGTATFPRVYTWFFRDPAPRILGFCTLIWEDGIAQAYPMEYGVVTGDLHGGFGTDLPSFRCRIPTPAHAPCTAGRSPIPAQRFPSGKSGSIRNGTSRVAKRPSGSLES